MFERLMNLDVELRCLATRAFVAKEEIVDHVLYPVPKKSKSSDEESSKKDDKKNESIDQNEADNEEYSTQGTLTDEEIDKLVSECGDSKLAHVLADKIRKKRGAKSSVNTQPQKESEKPKETTKVDVKESLNKFNTLIADVLEKEGNDEVRKYFVEAINEATAEIESYLNLPENEKPSLDQVITRDENAINPYLAANSGVELVAVPVVEKTEPVVNGMDFSALQQGVSYENPQNSVLRQSAQPPLHPVTQEDADIAIAKEHQNQQPVEKPKKK